MEIIDIDIDKVILENINIAKAILQNIDIDKISNQFKFGISNRASRGAERLEGSVNLRWEGGESFVGSYKVFDQSLTEF